MNNKPVANNNTPKIHQLRDYYLQFPRMISSPFGGIDKFNLDLLRTVLDQLKIPIENRSVLDVGCGRGFLQQLIETHHGFYAGIDLVPAATSHRLVLGDAHHLPFPSDFFDLIFCIDAFEHFYQPETVIHEFRRVLRPKSTVFLSIPNYANLAGLVKWWCEHFGNYPQNSWAPFGKWQPQEFEAFLTANAVQRLFTKTGFTCIKKIPYDREILLGIVPWVEHPRMPKRIQFGIVWIFEKSLGLWRRLCPWMSLHYFLRFDLLEK